MTKIETVQDIVRLTEDMRSESEAQEFVDSREINMEAMEDWAMMLARVSRLSPPVIAMAAFMSGVYYAEQRAKEVEA